MKQKLHFLFIQFVGVGLALRKGGWESSGKEKFIAKGTVPFNMAFS